MQGMLLARGRYVQVMDSHIIHGVKVSLIHLLKIVMLLVVFILQQKILKLFMLIEAIGCCPSIN